MVSAGVSRSLSEMQAKSWPMSAPAAALAAWKAEMPGWISTATRRAAVGDLAVAAGLEQFEHERGHGVDLRVAGADQRDGLAGRGELEGVADAGLFVAEREAVLVLGEAEVGDEVEIEVVADPVGGAVERGDGGGGAAGAVAGADADDVQQARARGRGSAGSMGAAARPMAQVARRDLRLGDEERAGLERGGFGDAGGAGFGFDDGRGIDAGGRAPR